MRKQYAPSLYSEKSTTSAKSGRSFLSMRNAIPIWPSFGKGNTTTKQSIWKSLKGWIPSRTIKLRRKSADDNSEMDADSIGAQSSSITTVSSTSSSASSYTKLKERIFSFGGNSKTRVDDENVVVPSGTDSVTTKTETGNLPVATTSPIPIKEQQQQPSGILINPGVDSAEAIARRRKERREYLARARQKRQHHNFMMDKPSLTDEDEWGPRVTFIEPSPVPRFRNVAPAPPPSPPYLNIHVLQKNSNNTNSDDRRDSVIAPSDDKVPTVYTTPAIIQQQQRQLTYRQQQHRPQRLCFYAPLHRGQTLTFSLENALPEDHIIVYKFLTSNTKLRGSRRRAASKSAEDEKDGGPWTPFHSNSASSLMERYFVRPSAGRIVDQDQVQIMLFLNQVPDLAPGDLIKDKVLVRWAVVQRDTKVDAWVRSLPESTRRKWLEMLLERWPDQVIVRETRLKIRFLY